MLKMLWSTACSMQLFKIKKNADTKKDDDAIGILRMSK